MIKLRSVFFIVMALVLLIAGSGFTRLNSYTGFCTEWHVVQQGESLETISREYGVSRSELVAINELPNPKRVYPGQRLCVETGPQTSSSRYILKPGIPPSARFIPSSSYHPHEDSSYHPKQRYDRDYDCFQQYDYDRCRMDNYWHDDYRDDCREWYREHPDWDYCDPYYDGYYKDVRWAKNPYWHEYPYEDKYPYYKSDYHGIPTVSIVGVTRNKAVKFRTHNFPRDYKFVIFMGPSGTKGKNGYHAGTFYSGQGGSFVVTAKIPSQLKGAKKIAIRTESTTGGFYSYNWFYNNTTH